MYEYLFLRMMLEIVCGLPRLRNIRSKGTRTDLFRFFLQSRNPAFLCHIIGDESETLIGLWRSDPSVSVLEASERKNALKRLEDEMRTVNSPNYVMQMLDVGGRQEKTRKYLRRR